MKHPSFLRSSRRSVMAGALLVAIAGASSAHEVRRLPVGEALLPFTRADVHVELTADWDLELDGSLRLDFGDVPLGAVRARTIEITNSSDQTQAVAVSLSGPSAGVILGFVEAVLAPAATEALVVSFAPFSLDDAVAATLSITATDPLGFGEGHDVGLLGVPVDAGPLVTVDPDHFDVEVPTGSNPQLRMTVTNQHEAAVALTFDVGSSPGGAVDITFLPPELELLAGLAAEVDVVLTAQDIHPPLPLEITAETVTGYVEVVTVPLSVTVNDTFAEVDPTSLDFGAVDVGSSAVRQLLVTNTSIGPISVQVTAPSGEPIAFGPGDDAFELGIGDSRPLQVTYAPQDADHPPLTRLTVLAINQDGYPYRIFVDLQGQPSTAQASLVAYQPFTSPGAALSEITFGDVVAGGSFAFDMIVANLGEAPTSGARISFPGLDDATGCAGTTNQVCFQRRRDDGVFEPVSSFPQELEPDDGIYLRVIWSPAEEDLQPPAAMTVLGAAEPLELPLVGQSVSADNAVVQVLDLNDTILTDLLLDGAERQGDETLIKRFRLKNLGQAQTVGEALELDDASSCLQDTLHNKCFYDVDGGPIARYELAASEVKDVILHWHYAETEEDGLDTVSFANSLDPLAQGYQVAPLRVHTKAEEDPIDAPGTTQGADGSFGAPDEFGGARGLINQNAFFSDTSIDSINRLNGNLVATIPIGTPWQVGPSFTYGLSLVYNSNQWLVRQITEVVPAPFMLDVVTMPVHTNAGLGWHLSMGGRLYAGRSGGPIDWPGRGSNRDWVYVDATGGAHPVSRPSGASHYYPDDESGIRVRDDGLLRVHVDLPSGLTETFTPDFIGCPDGFDDCWRLSEISDAFGNTVSFDYESTDVLKIADSHGRVMRVRFADIDRPEEPLPGSVFRIVSEVVLPSTVDGGATWTFNWSPKKITRRCPVDPDQSEPEDYWSTTVAFLDGVALPDVANNGAYVFTYDKELKPGDNCRDEAGLLTSIQTPSQGKIEYGYGYHYLPTVCPMAPIQDPNETAELTEALGVVRRTVSGHGRQKSQQTFHRELADREHMDDRCSRYNTMETHVNMLPPVERESVHYYRREISFHNVTKTTDGHVPSEGSWEHRDYGLPISKNPALSVFNPDADNEEELFLSKIVLECQCPQPPADAPNAWCSNVVTTGNFEEDGIPSTCRVHRKEYQAHAYRTEGFCHDFGFELGACRLRARPVKAMFEATYGTNADPATLGKWIDTRYREFDGFGHYRRMITRSNIADSGVVTTRRFTRMRPPVVKGKLSPGPPGSLR